MIEAKSVRTEGIGAGVYYRHPNEVWNLMGHSLHDVCGSPGVVRGQAGRPGCGVCSERSSRGNFDSSS